MKKLILITLVFFTLLNSFAQKWQHIIGLPNQNDYSNRLIEHYDNGYLITGGYNDFNGWLVKTDINGNVIWDKILGIDPDVVLITKTIFDDQGNMYVFGTQKKENLDHAWPLVVKLNACGEKQWCRLLNFSGFQYGSFYDAILLDNGDVLGLASMPNEDQHDKIHLICLSPDGEYKWKESYASKDDYPNFANRLGSRVQKFGEQYIISGYVYSPHPSNPGIVSIRPMFIGIDSLFNEQWVLEFGLMDNMKGKALTSIPINDSLFMGVGRYRYGNVMDAWAMFYNKEGEQIGYQVFPTDSFGPEISESTFYEIENVNDSIYIATAGFYSDELDGYAKGEIVFDTSGNVYNHTIRYESSASTYLDKTFDNKYIITTTYLNSNLTLDIYIYKINENLEHDTVYPGSYTYDSLCPALPIQSGVIDLAGCDLLTGMEEIPSLEDYYKQKNSIVITAFPNPAQDGTITLEFKNTENFDDMELKCFDVFGKQVHSEVVYQYQGESKMDVGSWKKGVYVAIVYNQGLPVGRCKFVVQ